MAKSTTAPSCVPPTDPALLYPLSVSQSLAVGDNHVDPETQPSAYDDQNVDQSAHEQSQNGPGHFDMAPPPESIHPTFAALHSFAQTHAAAHGYALSINTTAKNRARVKLACVCYGAPKNTHHLTPETRVRKNRASAKTGCRMWIEGKKSENGFWTLKIGEPAHNHEGRHVEDWAVHRRRTWALGTDHPGGLCEGGVVASTETSQRPPSKGVKFGLNSAVGDTVWQVVAGEMAKGSRGSSTAENGVGGRDRGVGRTVKVLQEKLPGIRIFKRDIYNIRAQIKKARKEHGPDGNALQHDQLPSRLDIDLQLDGFGDDITHHNQLDVPHAVNEPGSITNPTTDDVDDHEPCAVSSTHDPAYSGVDPQLVEQCGAALREAQRNGKEPDHLNHQDHAMTAQQHGTEAPDVPAHMSPSMPPPPHSSLRMLEHQDGAMSGGTNGVDSEVRLLREELALVSAARAREAEESRSEIQLLRSELEQVKLELALLYERRDGGGGG